MRWPVGLQLWSVVDSRELCADTWDLSPPPCMAEWAVDRRIPTAAGRAATFVARRTGLSVLNEPMSLTGLSVVPVGFPAKQAVDRVAGCSAMLVYAPPNLGPLDGGWQLFAEGQSRAGGLVLGLPALEGEAG